MANNPYPGQGYPQAPGQHQAAQQQYPQQGYPQQPQQPQLPQQQGAPPPAPEPPAPRGPSVLGPPQGPAKMLYVGVVLMLVAFSAKQVMVNLSLKSSGNLLEHEKVEAQMAVEIGEINEALDPIDTEIDELEAEAPKPPKASADDKEEVRPEGNKDFEAFMEKKGKHEEKVAKLRKKRQDQDADLEDKRKAVRKKYGPELRAAARTLVEARAAGIGRVQLTLIGKLILDFLKIGGAALCVLAGLGIAADKEQPTSLQIYAAVIGGIAFLAVVAGGVAALLG